MEKEKNQHGEYTLESSSAPWSLSSLQGQTQWNPGSGQAILLAFPTNNYS